uniref:PAS domain-containing protein n=1 Tax=Hemiselmis andersenii TaxID=464988 RepID=A0A6U2BMS7_HEMAN|mmetsp:Transcript_17245/g.39768  ORF Transcript_17245/g.39768 Transcript_17245/m.39768 type:complete len:445 (-) Transcript_17245:202-1536(-)
MRAAGIRPQPAREPVAGMDFSSLATSLAGLNEAFVLVKADTPDNQILHVNGFWTALTGYQAHEAVGHPWSMLVLGRETCVDDANSLNAAVNSGQTAAVCLVSYKKTGVRFCNHLLAIPIGRLGHTGSATTVVCLMMREIPAGSSAAYRHLVHSQQMQGALAVRTQLTYRNELSALPVSLSQCSVYDEVSMDVEHSGLVPGGQYKSTEPQLPVTASQATSHNEEFVLRAVAEDDYASLRRMLIQGGDAGIQRLGKIHNLTCRVCPPNRDISIIVMGGFTSASGDVLKELGREGLQQGVAICEADLMQYALCHSAFQCCALLFLAGWTSWVQTSCSLVLWNAGEESLRQRMTTEEVCSMYSRSLASEDAAASNDYANAAFALRHSQEVLRRMKSEGRAGAAGVAMSPEDGKECVGSMVEAVQQHLTNLHDQAQAQHDAQKGMWQRP